jgi:hypothetical protein
MYTIVIFREIHTPRAKICVYDLSRRNVEMLFVPRIYSSKEPIGMSLTGSHQSSKYSPNIGMHRHMAI